MIKDGKTPPRRWWLCKCSPCLSTYVCLSLHCHRTRRMIRTMFRLLFAFLFLLALLPFLVIVVSFSLLVFFLVGIARLFARRQILGDVAVVFMLFVFLFVLPRWRCVENSILFGKRYIWVQSEASELNTCQRNQLLASNWRFIDDASEWTVVNHSRSIDDTRQSRQKGGQLLLDLFTVELWVCVLQSIMWN